jgi:tetraacyldisaccharide 4'-kinase
MRAPQFWESVPPTSLAKILRPFSAIYGWAAAERMAQGGERAAAPAICVGNFVAGGAGKTPAAIAVARLLIEMGEHVAFLSRGYGGTARGEPVRVDPSRYQAAEVGDEPLLLARVAPTFVSRDRPAAARAAVAAGASVLVLDDGLQNPSLVKDFSLALVDGGFGFGNGLCMPAGPLRAPLAAQAQHVALIVAVAGAGAATPVAPPPALAKIPVIAARIEPDAEEATRLRGKDVFAFAGIGRPQKFFETLKGVGARLVAERSFPDHHRYAPGELATMFAEASAAGLPVVTTEKDFVRLPAAYAEKAVALPVRLQFEDAPRLTRLLAEALARRRAKA